MDKLLLGHWGSLRERAWLGTTVLAILLFAFVSACDAGTDLGSGTAEPDDEPTFLPTPSPSLEPTPMPAFQPTVPQILTPSPVVVPTIIPVRSPSPSPTPEPIITPTRGPTPTLEPTVTPTPIPTAQPEMRLALSAEAAFTGYWSDDTANVVLAVTLRNEGGRALDRPILFDIACIYHDIYAEACAEQITLSLPDGYGSATQTTELRAPTGNVSISITNGDGLSHDLQLDIPQRILGVDREVWACFSDTSKLNTIWHEDEGIGCGGWPDDKILKWDVSAPLKISVNGPEEFNEEFLEVLSSLSDVVGIDFVRTDEDSKADISVHLGLTPRQAWARDLHCISRDALGCANSEYNTRTREILRSEIIVYNLWPSEGADFGDFSEPKRELFRSTMIHELVHSLTRMQHRTELLSVLKSEGGLGPDLSPMDEALLRLHGHKLVKPGMTISEIRQLIVFNNELLDPHPAEPRFAAWSLVSKAYDKLREATSSKFRMRHSLRDCGEVSEWADYKVGNLTGESPFFSWVQLGGGENTVYVIEPYSDSFEQWRWSPSGQLEVSRSKSYLSGLGWRGDLADPHHILESLLYFADWSEVEIGTVSKGQKTLSVNLDTVRGPTDTPADSVTVALILDNRSHEISEFIFDWELTDSICPAYRVEAMDGRYGIDFLFPNEVHRGSSQIVSCEARPLGVLRGFMNRQGEWSRECGYDRAAGEYTKEFSFSLQGWAFVRMELLSVDDISIDLWNQGEPSAEPLDLGDGGYLVGGHGVPDEHRMRWMHGLLAPGTYRLEAHTKNRAIPGSFSLAMMAQPTPPPPLSFRSVDADSTRTCGLLTDGTPLCWGTRSVDGEGSEAPHGRFASISTGRPTCAIREDGTPHCWDFKDPGEHDCEYRNGSVYCRLRDQPSPLVERSDLEGGTVAFADVTVIGGYFDQTPPFGERLTSISTGWAHSCGLLGDGTPVCWGRNEEGESSPPRSEKFVLVDAGGGHSCGLREDGSAVCWGADTYGQASPPEDMNFVAVNAGEEHSCGLRDDGSIFCWGRGGLSVCSPLPGGFFSCWSAGSSGYIAPQPPENESYSLLASGSPNCALTEVGSPVCWTKYLTGLTPVPEGESFSSISASPRHACGIRQDGSVACWGWNRYGEASPPTGVYLTTTDTGRIPADLESISSGGYHTCAVDSEGYAVCWGPNWWQGRLTDRFTSVTSGEFHTCGLRADRKVVCRGSDEEGQSTPPIDETFVFINAGNRHTCGLRPDGTAVCWGSNDYGQSSAPLGEMFIALSAGVRHTCGLRESGAIECWGAVDHGQASSPRREIFSSLSSGNWHTCGLLQNGSPLCWGLDREGQVSPPEGLQLVSLSSGGWHTCGLRADGAAVCWGADWSGQSSPPSQETFVAISSGGLHTCGLRTDGTTMCWGEDKGGQASPGR